MVLFLLSIIITALIPLSIAEFYMQYQGGFDLVGLFVHQPILSIATFLSLILSILLFLNSFRKKVAKNGDSSALLLLSLLQERGRFLDFLSRDITPYTDTQVSSAARVVHSGCRKVIEECFDPAPIVTVEEGAQVEGINGEKIKEFRLVGKVGAPPYRGRVLHRGWKITKEEIPVRKEGVVPSLVAPVELEVSNS